jgi:hypothetical protein
MELSVRAERGTLGAAWPGHGTLDMALIDEAIARLEELTISSPSSLYKTVAAIAGQGAVGTSTVAQGAAAIERLRPRPAGYVPDEEVLW